MFTLILKPFKDWPGVVLLLLASTACAYHSPTEPTLPPADLAAPAALVVNAAPGRAGGTATVTALVSNRAGAPLAAVTVTFRHGLRAHHAGDGDHQRARPRDRGASSPGRRRAHHGHDGRPHDRRARRHSAGVAGDTGGTRRADA